MIHIESKTGKSYGICEMSDIHLKRTIDYLIKKIKLINKSKNNNPRYLDDVEREFERLSQYFFVAKMRGDIIHIIKLHEIGELFNEYIEYRKAIYIKP